MDDMSFKELKAVLGGPALGPEPDPLRREPSPPEFFPIDALGSILGSAARRLMAVIKAPDSICGQSVLAAAALAVQGHANLIIDGRVRPLSLFFLTVGESGERKSAVDDEALRPHNIFQKELADTYRQQFEEYENRLAAWKQCREELKRPAKNKSSKGKGKVTPIGDWVPQVEMETMKAALNSLGSAPMPPLTPVIKASEPTYEGIYKLLVNGYPSIGIFSDEGGQFIGGCAMNNDNALKTAAGLSKLWDGKPLDRVRGGDGSSLLYGRRVSLHLMMQGVVAEVLFGNRTLKDQGLLSRCLPSWPTSTAGTRFYVEVDLTQSPDMQRYHQRMREILEADLPLKEEEAGTRNELDPRNVPLADDAKKLWVRFHDVIEGKLGDGGELASIRGFASKAAEHAARIAGVLALVDDLDAQEISLQHMERGISLADFYLTEVLRIHDTHAVNPDIPLAEKLLAWAQRCEYIYLRQIYRLGPNAIREAEAAKRIAKILEEHGWLLPIEGGMVLDGAHRTVVWQVWRAHQ